MAECNRSEDKPRVPTPIALGLTLCDLVIVEEGTRKQSLIGTPLRLKANRFPYIPPPFFAHSALADGFGPATIHLLGIRLDNGEEIGRKEREVQFADRLQELHVLFRIDHWVFPVAGAYEFSLYVDGECVTRRRVIIR